MTGPAGYARRAPYYAAEISRVPEPSLLKGLLKPGLAVAEMPSGTGHFLPAYAAFAADVTLADACPQMLEAAREQAGRCGTPITAVCGNIEDLPGRAGPFGLVVMPNGALNQLAAVTSPGTVLAPVSQLLRPGGLVLAQVLEPGSACGFYDPGTADDRWIQDRRFPAGDGRTITRWRRQHHHGGGVTVDFEIRCDGQEVHGQEVTVRLLPVGDVQAALAEAGLRTVSTARGPGGLTELLGWRPHGEEP